MFWIERKDILTNQTNQNSMKRHKYKNKGDANPQTESTRQFNETAAKCWKPQKQWEYLQTERVTLQTCEMRNKFWLFMTGWYIQSMFRLNYGPERFVCLCFTVLYKSQFYISVCFWTVLQYFLFISKSKKARLFCLIVPEKMCSFQKKRISIVHPKILLFANI